MANSIVRLATEYFPDPDKGRPLWNAKIYVGVPDLNPRTPANQKAVTGRQENGTEVMLAQPIRTSSGGVPVNASGDVVTLLVDGAYSMAVDDRQDVQQYYFANVLDGAPVTFNDNPVLYRDTIAIAVADEGLSAGQYITTKGYNSVNDGGGADYVVVAGSTGTDDGGSYHDMANGNQLELIYDGVISLRAYGIVGDNVADDSVQFERALAVGLPVEGAELHLKLTNTSGFVFTNDINGHNLTLDFSSIGSNVFRKLLFSTGTKKSEEIIGDVLAGATTITYTGSVSVGDTLVIHNDEDCFNADPLEGIKRGELFEVIRIEGSTVHLHRAVLLTLNSSTCTVYAPTTASVRGVNFIGNGFDITENNETAVQIEFGKDNVVENCSTDQVEHYSVNVDSCLRPLIRFNTFKHDQPDDPQAVQDAGKVVYGIAIFNCTSEMDCHDNNINGGKHQIDFTQNSTNPGYGVFNIIHDNVLSSCWHSSIATHDANTETLVTDNSIYDTMRGVEFRTPNNYAYNNNISVRRLRGVSGGEGVYLTEDFSGCIIKDNKIDALTRCIRTSAGVTSTGVEISGNALSDINGATDGILLNVSITDGVIKDNYAVGDSFSTSNALIRSDITISGGVVSGNSSKGRVLNLLIDDAIVSENKRTGAGFCATISGSGNIIHDNTSLTGVPVSAVGEYQRNNYSKDSFNTSIRTSGSDQVIDAFDTYLEVDPDGSATLDRIFTSVFNGMFVLNLTSGSVTVNNATSTTDEIRTLSGSPYVWNAGTPLILAKTSVGFFQIVAL